VSGGERRRPGPRPPPGAVSTSTAIKHARTMGSSARRDWQGGARGSRVAGAL